MKLKKQSKDLYLFDSFLMILFFLRFQMLIPKIWNNNAVFKNVNLKPVCIHLAGTGDHVYMKST